jgi:hypothetical protein
MNRFSLIGTISPTHHQERNFKTTNIAAETEVFTKLYVK